MTRPSRSTPTRSLARAARALALSLLASAVSLAPSRASAQADAVDASARARTAALSWVRLPGAEACPSTQDVAHAVEDRLGRSVLVSAADAELAIEGRIERREGSFVATLTVADASGASLGERVLEQRAETEGDCAEILPALALAIALTIDPDALLRAPDEAHEEADPEPDTPGDDAPLADAPLADDAVPPPEPRDRWRFEITALAAGTLGLSPTAAAGGALTLALSPPGFVPVYIHGVLAPFSRAEPAGSAPVDVLQSYVGLGLCPLALRETAPVTLLACAGIDVGALVTLSARETLTEPERITVQADVSFGAHVTIVGPLYFAADVALLVPFRGDPYLLRGPPERPWYDPEPVAGVLRIGVGLDVVL